MVSVVVVVVLLAGTLLALGFGGKGPLSALGNKSTQTTTNSKTPAATPTPSIPAGFQMYTSEGHFYSVAVPSDWPSSVDKSDREEVEFTGPANQVVLTDDFAPNPGVTPESYTTTICSIVGDSSTTPQSTQVTIGGQSWTKMECESSDGSSHTVVEAVTYKDKMVSLLFSSDGATFAQDQSKYFSIIEQTFTFLS